MSGIDRLRALSGAWDEWGLGGALADVADQIEREQNEDAEAIAWVREHGGLEEVEAQWSGRVPLTSVKRMVELHKKKRDRLKAHALWLERKCHERREHIEELRRTIAEMRPRLMPEGYEWPRYTSGGLVEVGDDVVGPDYGERIHVDAVKFHANGFTLCDKNGFDMCYQSDERFERPAVLAADGEPLEVGQTVWDENGDELVIGALEGGGHTVTCRYVDVGDAIPVHGMWSPSDLTHQRPVLAADGRPLREGETVWYRGHADPLEVRGISTTGSGAHYVKAYNDYEGEVSAPAECFTHERPESWERLEEDADRGPHGGMDFEEFARDLVRRAKKLAGVSE